MLDLHPGECMVSRRASSSESFVYPSHCLCQCHPNTIILTLE